MKMKPIVGISSCLLGNSVRYDGGHKKNNWIVSELGSYVIWEPFCPEVTMGLGTPREPIHFEETSGGLRLVSIKTKIDLTEAARLSAQSLVASMPSNLSGFILKKNLRNRQTF